MNNFPSVVNNEIKDVLVKLYQLYEDYPYELLHSAELAAKKIELSFEYDDTKPAENQLTELSIKASRRGDRKGFSLFINLAEQLFLDLNKKPLSGIAIEGLLKTLEIKLSETSYLYLTIESIWKICWKVEIEGEVEMLEVSLRAGGLQSRSIVPKYVIENLEQGIFAFTNNSNGVSLSLLSISLESALRDSLILLGYDYKAFGSSENIYEMSKVRVAQFENQLTLKPLDSVPSKVENFINENGKDYVDVNIKRENRNGKWSIKVTAGSEIIMDYLTKDIVTTRAVKKISGLGAALKIARNEEMLIKRHVFPLDLDSPVKEIRNNLIHLSGSAMEVEVFDGKSLKEFIENRELVFDTIKSIINVIDDLYSRISNGEIKNIIC
ncbi:hypothetical protein [Marinicella rhabdoformis]|uniref:hypothetical protein n=1 Tax=Marinicella rhabdoformis TaxID=2580566 RepID=UPI0012AEBF4D|nr:hypothetical protein [Marinicella rhabdoformis]